VYITDAISPQTYKEIVLYEGGIKKGTYVVTDFTYNVPGGTLTFGCQDYSKRLQDYFIPDTTIITEPTYGRAILEKYLTEAGVEYNFTSSDNGSLVNNNQTYGLTDTLSVCIQILQMNGWYMYFDPENIAQIGRFEFDSDSADYTVDAATMLSFSTTNNDAMFRNRVVVWGMGDPTTDQWVFAEIDQHGQYSNEYDGNDERSIVIVNQNIPDNDAAMLLANQAIKEFDKSSFEVTFNVAGPVDLVLGDHVYVDSKYLRHIGPVTSIGSELGPSGHTTHAVLSERCPRLFSYYDYGGYVYVGTESEGIWRKHLKYDHTWRDFSEGLTCSGVTDLYVTNGKFACTTNDGRLWERNVTSSGWSLVTASGYTQYGHGITDDNLDFVAVSINDVDSTIYAIANLRQAIIGGENCYLLTKKGNESTLEQVSYLGDYIVTGVDVDNDHDRPVVSVIVGGRLYIDHTVVRNSERVFEHFEDDSLSDLKNGISYYRNIDSRTHPGWSDGRQQQPPNTFYGPYAYQPVAFYEGTYYFGSYVNSVWRLNQRNFSDPAKSVTGFGLSIGSVDVSIIDADRAVITGTTLGVIGHTETGRRSYLADFNSTVDAIPLPPATFNISACYAIPNGWVISTGISGDRYLRGSVYDADYYGYNLGKILGSETGDIIQAVSRESGNDENGDPKIAQWYGGVGNMANVDGMTYGVHWTVEAGGTEFYPTNWNYYHCYTFKYGVDIKGGLMINSSSEEIDRFALRSWTEKINNVEYIRDNGKDAVIGGPGGMGIDYISKVAYFTIETVRGGSDIVQLYSLNLNNIADFTRVAHQMGDYFPTGFLSNEQRFYFTVGNKIFRSTNLSTPLCTLPEGAIVADKLDSKTNEGIFTIWKPLPNPDNTAHYEIYSFNPEFGTYSLLNKTITNQYTNFNGTIDPYNHGFDFRGNRLTMGGDSQWTLFPTTTTEYAATASIPMILTTTSGVHYNEIVSSGVVFKGAVREFEYSTAAERPVKIEISNDSPYVAFGGAPVTFENQMTYSGAQKYSTSGVFMVSRTAQVGDWNYTISGFTSSGNVTDARSFSILTTTSGQGARIIYTQHIPASGLGYVGSGMYGIHMLAEDTNGDWIPSTFYTFSGVVEMLETTNRQDQPYIFASTSGARMKFYQRDGGDGLAYVGDFIERINNLPNSRITTIRVDNRI
jgi:hypothetical protein